MTTSVRPSPMQSLGVLAGILALGATFDEPVDPASFYSAAIEWHGDIRLHLGQDPGRRVGGSSGTRPDR